MTAPNHALTGTLIGLTVGNPWLALPLALASHFICDAIPHYGAGQQAIATKRFQQQLIVEALVCASIVLILAFLQPQHWVVGAVAAFVATSPDFMWINKFRRAQSGKPQLVKQAFILRFHAWIQWFERPSGAIVEIAWLTAMLVFLIPLVR